MFFIPTVVYASTPQMYVICVYLLCASEHEIESQSNEILLSVHTFIHIVLASYMAQVVLRA